MEHEMVHLRLRSCTAVLFSLHWHVQMCGKKHSDLHNPALNVYDLRQTDGTWAWRREETDGWMDPAATVLHWDHTESQISIKVGACVQLLVPAKSIKTYISMTDSNIQ